MAIVRGLELRQLEAKSVHSEVNGSYSVIAGPDGLYLQIDTYGSRERKLIGKKSQSIRFAPEAIEELKAIMGKYFP